MQQQHHGGADDYLHEEAGTSSSMGAAALTPPSTPRMGSTFLDFSGSSFAPESVMMNTGAQITNQNIVSACFALLRFVRFHFVAVHVRFRRFGGQATTTADAEH